MFSTRPSWLARLIALLFFGGMLGLIFLLSRFTPGLPEDLEVYLQAARRLSEGKNIYQHTYIIPRPDWVMQNFFIYPPLLPVLLKPFAYCSAAEALNWWNAVNYLCILIGSISLAQLLQHTPARVVHLEWRTYIVAGIAVIFPPTWLGFRLGQIHGIIFALVAIFIRLVIENRTHLAGAILALATWLKMSPLFLLLLPCALKQKRVVLSIVAVSTAIVGVIYLFEVDYRVLLQFLSQQPLLGNSELTAIENNKGGNFTPILVVVKLMGLTAVPHVQTVFRVMILAFTVGYLFRVPSKSAETALNTAAMLITVMVMISPMVWAHHFTWLLIPLIFAACSVANWKEHRMLAGIGCLAIFAQLCQAETQSYQLREAELFIQDLWLLTPTVSIGLLLLILHKNRQNITL